MILRDPVHGLLEFDDDDDLVITRLLATREVQRLRRIRQLGFTSLAYPGAEHSRFAHALGTAHVMKRLLRRLQNVDSSLRAEHRMRPEHRRDALAAALLHDIGHGPLSHMFEHALPGAHRHEAWTEQIILDDSSEVHRALVTFDPDMPRRVGSLVLGHHELPYLARAVSGTFDVDRCDYLLRDAHATGVRYGNFDLDWFQRSFRYAPYDASAVAPPLAIDGAKGMPAIESFIMARLFMFQQVYFHKATRAAEWMVQQAVQLAVRSLADGTVLDGTPAAIRSSARGEQPTLQQYVALDDASFVAALEAWEEGPVPVLADLCRRVRKRSLFKTIEIFGDAREDDAALQRLVAIARAITERAGLDPDVYVGIDRASDTPFSSDHDSLVVVFGKGRPRRPAEVSLLLRRLDGERLARLRLIVAPEVRDQVRAEMDD